MIPPHNSQSPQLTTAAIDDLATESVVDKSLKRSREEADLDEFTVKKTFKKRRHEYV